jgi:DNA transformation protein and related proteins
MAGRPRALTIALGAEPVSDLRNLGPKSRQWLAAIGIHTVADLRAAGAVPTYVALKRSRGGISLNMLYALVGALDGMHWQDIRRTRRLELLLQVEDCEREQAAASIPRGRRGANS